MYAARWVNRGGSNKKVTELSGDRQVSRMQEVELLRGKVEPEIQVIELLRGGLELETWVVELFKGGQGSEVQVAELFGGELGSKVMDIGVADWGESGGLGTMLNGRDKEINTQEPKLPIEAGELKVG